jgi:hypothetical protein
VTWLKRRVDARNEEQAAQLLDDLPAADAAAAGVRERRDSHGDRGRTTNPARRAGFSSTATGIRTLPRLVLTRDSPTLGSLIRTSVWVCLIHAGISR